MAYSGRMSMAPRGSQQPSSQPRVRKEDNEDAFMTLVSFCLDLRPQTLD